MSRSSSPGSAGHNGKRVLYHLVLMCSRPQLALAALVLTQAVCSGCTFIRRGLTYPFHDPTFDVDWYQPT